MVPTNLTSFWEKQETQSKDYNAFITGVIHLWILKSATFSHSLIPKIANKSYPNFFYMKLTKRIIWHINRKYAFKMALKLQDANIHHLDSK